MAIEYKEFIHPSDRKALAALKAVPGFDLLVKKFMGVFAEKMYRIENTASYIRLGENQLPEIYNILVKVCNKLEIAVPELYLCLDREPNAYTYGDKEPFIVLHSGLLETLTLQEIETVIAHECGHILCHHVLYHTMGSMILTGADFFVNGIISGAIVASLQYAFYYWMRCSELSADRVCAHYHESAEPVVDVMLVLSGGIHNLSYSFNKEEFFKQAEEYKELVANSKYNKFLELIQIAGRSHPFHAYRAYEINEFCKNYNLKDMSEVKKLAEEKVEYSLFVTYVTKKQKSLFKKKVDESTRLEVKIGEESYVIEENETKEISLLQGEHMLEMSNGVKGKKHYVDLQTDTAIIVSWDSKEQTMMVGETL